MAKTKSSSKSSSKTTKKSQKQSLIEDLKGETMVGMDGEERILADYFSDDDFEISKDKKDVFIRHNALLRVAKKVFGGIKKRRAKGLGVPKKQDNFCAAAEVVYIFGDGNEVSALADCSSTTASPGFKNYTTALAETRASSRALRLALGVELVASEEMTDIESLVDREEGLPAQDQQKQLMKRKFMRKKEKGGKGKTYKDISLILGRKVRTLDELTRGEATNVLTAWNSEKED
jgi:hypothetical protein